ncbi:DUF1365 domain-containing protein [Undibacterium parvum]|uniref:DUF1365 domain-containing protein n=1 Tax=Undibacterium parvum TaxID=401471 RepID=A0A3Q9BQ02_9BURK|nr:DUF1365 domain-containing protein [Undibacterium parvum]AZP11880.1 DUF1365 domain-containing protein [Undibacterium parvum]
MHSQSSLLVAQVMHQRLRPVLHRFIYPVFFVRINLAHTHLLNNFIFGVNRWRPLSLFFKDYGPRDGSNLLLWIQDLLKNQGLALDGHVFLQTFPRIFGYAFNPINLWYCHNRQGELVAVLAEVNNTFGEHHLYLLRNEDGSAIRKESTLLSTKMMHVSPFCEVKGSYRFSFADSAQSSQVNIDYDDTEGVLINTAINARKQALSRGNLLLALLRQPLLGLGVVWRIHWQALLLWRKQVPFFHQAAAPASKLTVSHTESKERTK